MLEKLREGKFTYPTYQVLLGWVIDTVIMTFYLPSHWENRFKEILDGILTNQKRVGVDKWHRVLGDIFSIAIYLPGARGLFSYMKEALCHVEGENVALTRGVHQDLTYF